MIVTVSADHRAWEALLKALPRCVECPALAEIRLDGHPRCCNCAAKHRKGSFATLESADAAGAILDALCPHIPAGKWDGGVDG